MYRFFFYFPSLEMLDKMEPPAIPDGYGISIAYACLLDIVRSISLAIEGPSTVTFRHIFSIFSLGIFFNL